MKIENPELFVKTLQDIKNLRESLLDLECANPHLFHAYDGTITAGWEFWTTDEILGIISDEILDVLRTCKQSLQVELVGNSDTLKENEK